MFSDFGTVGVVIQVRPHTIRLVILCRGIAMRQEPMLDDARPEIDVKALVNQAIGRVEFGIIAAMKSFREPVDDDDIESAPI